MDVFLAIFFFSLKSNIFIFLNILYTQKPEHLKEQGGVVSICPRLQQSIDTISFFVDQKLKGKKGYLKVSIPDQRLLVTEKIDERSDLLLIITVMESIAQHLIAINTDSDIQKFNKSIDRFNAILESELLKGSENCFFSAQLSLIDCSLKIVRIQDRLKNAEKSSKLIDIIKRVFNSLVKETKKSFVKKNDSWSDFEIEKDTVIFRNSPSVSILEKLKAYPQIRCFDFSELKTVLLDAHLLNLKDEFVFFTNICRVNLHGKNKITLKGLEALRGLSSLKELDISGCTKIDGQQPFIFDAFPLITSLNLANCSQVTDTFLQGIDSLKHLESLDISSCYRITDDGIAFITKLEKLKYLNIHLCESIEQEGLKNLKQLKELKKLDLGYCRVSDEVVKEISSLKNLVHLDLTCSSRLTKEGFEHIATLNQLKGLTLFGCSDLSDKDMIKIAELKNLVFLDVGLCTQITDRGIEYIKGIKNLKNLKLYGCLQVSDKGLKSLSSLHNLTDLDLSFLEQITDEGISYLKSMNKLSNLALTYCEQVSQNAIELLKEFKPKLSVS